MILNPKQIRALKAGADVCAQVLTKLEYLEKLITSEPSIEPRVAQLREMLEHQRQLCGAGLALAGVEQ